MDGPVLVYDDGCSFCTKAARFVERRGRIRTVGFSDLDSTMRGRLPADYQSCAHLLTEEEVYSCGEAVERALARTDLVSGRTLSLLSGVPGYRTARERGYDLVAANRGHLSRLLGYVTPPSTTRAEIRRMG